MKRKKKILIVEDNESNRYLAKFILEKSGYRVIEACDGNSGVELAARERPSLIIMDIQLPGLNGVTSTRLIRESEADNRVPIVALTSYAMPGDKERALGSGCTGYIEKPINPDTFLSEVERYL